MKQLMRHLVRNNIDFILENSSCNCHVRGLHSIMLLDNVGQAMRLYVATDDHVIWKNGISGIPTTPMVSGYHPHHSDIMLHCVHGTVYNRRAEKFAGGIERGETFTLKRLRFDKSVEDKSLDTGFVYEGEDLIRITHNDILQPGDCVEMRASELHTIYIDQNECAAWFVYNGLPDKDYVPYLWTNADLHKNSSAELYNPMTQENLERLLKIARLS